MNILYKTQTNFIIQVTYSGEYDELNDVKLQYRKPDGTTGYFTVVTDTVAKTITYTPAYNAPLTMTGIWKFWVTYVSDDSRVHPSSSFEIKVIKEGQDY